MPGLHHWHACRSYLSFPEGFQKSGLKQQFLDELKFGADWLLTSHFSEDGFVAWTSAPGDLIDSHSFWGRPEDIKVVLARARVHGSHLLPAIS